MDGVPGRPVCLSLREAQVLEALAAGKLHKETASELGISEKTAARHCLRLYAKLGARNAPEAIWRATSLGLLPPAEPTPDEHEGM